VHRLTLRSPSGQQLETRSGTGTVGRCQSGADVVAVGAAGEPAEVQSSDVAVAVAVAVAVRDVRRAFERVAESRVDGDVRPTGIHVRRIRTSGKEPGKRPPPSSFGA